MWTRYDITDGTRYGEIRSEVNFALIFAFSHISQEFRGRGPPVPTVSRAVSSSWTEVRR